MPDIVIIDDDRVHARHLSRLASAHDLETSHIHPARLSPRHFPQAQLAVIRSERATELVRDLAEEQPETTMIVLDDRHEVDHVVACMRAGARDVLPVDLTDPESLSRLRQHFTNCRARPSTTPFPATCPLGMAGSSAATERVRSMVSQLAPTDATCLIEGPTGAGKELVALGLHKSGKRSAQPLVAVNCAAIPDDLMEGELFGYERGAFSGAVTSYPGKLALAHGGTLFLDEVGELSPAGQVKLLRALESRQCYRLGGREPFEFDVRIIAATNRDLAAEVASGRFRSDLYYRIAVGRIQITELAQRPDDILALAQHFIDQVCADQGRSPARLSQEAARALERHSWPGNARELRNAIEIALIGCRGDTIMAQHLSLPDPVNSAHLAAPIGDGARQLTRSTIESALSTARGNKSAAARLLGCSRMTLYRHLRRSLA